MNMEDGAVPVGDDGAVQPGNGELPPGGDRGLRDDIAAAGPRPLDEAAGGDAATACGFGSKIAAKCGRSFPNLTDRRPRHDGRCWPEVPQSSDFTGNWQRHSSHYNMNS